LRLKNFLSQFDIPQKTIHRDLILKKRALIIMALFSQFPAQDCKDRSLK